MRQEKLVNCQVSGLIFSFRTPPICSPFSATDPRPSFCFSFYCITVACVQYFWYIPTFLQLEDINLLMIIGLLLGCCLHEGVKTRDHEYHCQKTLSLIQTTSYEGFPFYYVKNISEILPSCLSARNEDTAWINGFVFRTDLSNNYIPSLLVCDLPRPHFLILKYPQPS